MSATFSTVRSVGGLLPSDLLMRVLSGDSTLPGLKPADYHLGAGESVREAANRAWSYLTGTWAAFTAAREKLAATEPAVGLTRERWLSLLFRELGYGRLPQTPAGGLTAGEKQFAISHAWERTPIHLLGWGVDLDRRTPGVAGAAARAPHALVQEYLNRADGSLWGIVTNGRVLRILRDSSSLAGQSFLEFDLEAMFEGEVFSDFVALFMVAHQSRVEVAPDAPPSDCWLEKWRTAAVEQGTRALGELRVGVREAIEALGTGFLHHPDNGALVHRLNSGELRLEDYHRALLRLVYRLLFLFVAEDRGALLAPDADEVARERYARYFSTARLRRLATRRRGTRHGDQWEALRLVIGALGRDGGRPELGLPGLGGLFEAGPADVVTDLGLANEALFAAVRRLAVVQLKGQPKRLVDYRNLGAEELGGIYESLLELVPRFDPVERTFTLENLAGNERKTSGSYYTPTSLIDLVLDTALDPLLDAAEREKDPEAALLGLTVCDPACGSGHFLVAAARRLAERVATVRTGEVDPSPVHQQQALYDVISRCIYGVDLNPMAAELAKVSLWIEALQPGRPLSFLDAHVKVGNSLLGTTPALLAAGIPDAAFTPIEGDDRKYAAALKKRNAAERSGQGELFGVDAVDPGNRVLREEVRRIGGVAALSLADVHLQEQRFRALEGSEEMRAALFEADAWCAAFVQRKVPGAPAITQSVLTTALDAVDPAVRREVEQLAARHRFFHWHLEFPEIFDVPDGGAPDTPTGWRGGFGCVVGNPPWDQMQLDPKEFFAPWAPEIVAAPNMAKRNRLIADLEATDPALFLEFRAAQRQSDERKHLVHASGAFPLSAYGRLNTYSLFAEVFTRVLDTSGRAGVITPTGVMTDSFNQFFAAAMLQSRRVAAFYDFENEGKIFPNVHHAFRFAVLSISGGALVNRSRFAFLSRDVADVPSRRYELTAEEVALLNPNTGTLPVFRSRRDAEITLSVYRRFPPLVREGSPVANRWGLRYQLMFMMNTASHLFLTEEDLRTLGATFDGWAWSKDGARWLPLYEAKMLSLFDHRYSTYKGATQAQLNMQTLPRLSDQDHANPSDEALPRYWVSAQEVERTIGDRWDRQWLLGWRDITGQEKWRTFVPSALPRSAVGHAFPVVHLADHRHAPLIQAVWSSFACDYITRQKLSSTHLTFGVLNQIACPAPDTFEQPAPWQPDVTLAEYITPRVVELNYTSHRMAPYARDFGHDGPPFHWDPDRRALLKAELDATMFHIYGLNRDEVEHVLDSFPVVRKYDERDYGEYRTKRQILESFDATRRDEPLLSAGGSCAPNGCAATDRTDIPSR